MKASSVLFGALQPLIPLCALSVLYLYLYPVFHGCAFPVPGFAPSDTHRGFSNASLASSFLGPFGFQQHAARAAAHIPPTAPFRLLALGDPQLEGDTSLPKLNRYGEGLFPSLAPLRFWHTWARLELGTIKTAFAKLFSQDVAKLAWYAYKSVDLWGNDLYLGHIYRTMDWWTEPTHLVVLGDLLGSQWIGEEEFARRSDRFWNKVMKGTTMAVEDIMAVSAQDASSEHTQVLGADPSWRKRVIAVAGNHDIGYAGDIDEKRVERFEKRFGKVNWSVRFSLPRSDDLDSKNTTSEEHPPVLRLVVLNDMNLDTPAFHKDLQAQTYEFLNKAINSQSPIPSSQDDPEDVSATLLLTHIPLHKPAGVCADAPFFDFFPEDVGGGVKEQNHLSEYSSRSIVLEGIFGLSGNRDAPGHGMGRRGLILNGHDHVGCDTFHFWNNTSSSGDVQLGESDDDGENEDGPRWDTVRWVDADELVMRNERALRNWSLRAAEAEPGLREVTVRSIMGEFGGNAGLVSAWFDEELRQWRFEYSSCALGVQHVWWGIHIFALITALVFVTAWLALALESMQNDAPDLYTVGEKGTLANGWNGSLRSRKGLTKQKSSRSLRGKRRKK